MMTYESKKKPGTFLTTDGIVDDKTKTLFVTVKGFRLKRNTLNISGDNRAYAEGKAEGRATATAREISG